jgi:hypothetical protein
MNTHEKIIQWAKDRKIIPNSSTRIQCLKAVSEIGELADALIKHDVEAIKDAAGDIMVCMYIADYLSDDGLIDKCELAAVSDISLSLSFLIKFHGISRSENINDVLAFIIEPYNLTLDECIDSAYEVIKDRKGTLLDNGVFVKDESQKEPF